MIIRFMRHAASDGLNLLVGGLKEEGHDARKIKLSGSRYRGLTSHRIINWGSSSWGSVSDQMVVLNKPEAIAIAADKIKTLILLNNSGMRNFIPNFALGKATAASMFNEGLKVYCRTLARSSQGNGIVIASSSEELVDAPLYTEEIKVDREVRVHVFKGEVIDFAQKKKMGSERRSLEGIESSDESIKSHSRGWVFARAGIQIPDEAKDIAIRAVAAIGLDFGAVDLAITPQGTVKIFEVNTAPGLEGTTLQSYLTAIRGWLNG